MKIGSSIVLAVAFASNVTAFAPSQTARPSVGLNMASEIDDKTEVREYFNSEGFNRWNKIYSESDDVNSVQLDIRDGHDQTIQKILNWISDDGNIAGKTVCDCGCGVGSLAIPLAQMGTSLDIVLLYVCRSVLVDYKCSLFHLLLVVHINIRRQGFC